MNPIWIKLSCSNRQRGGNLIGRVVEGADRGMVVLGEFSGHLDGEFVAIDPKSPRSVKGTAIIGVFPWSFLTDAGFVFIHEAESMYWNMPLEEAKAKFALMLPRAIIVREVGRQVETRREKRKDAANRREAEIRREELKAEMRRERRKDLREEKKRVAFLNSLPVEVTTISMEYQAGDYIAWNGVKGGGKRGYGWASAPIPSKLFVVISVKKNVMAKVRVDRTFKEEVGRLSPKRKLAINACRPTKVTLVRGNDPWYGEDQVLVSDGDMAQWLGRVKDAIAK